MTPEEAQAIIKANMKDMAKIVQDAIGVLHPELAESEDEKMCTRCIDLLQKVSAYSGEEYLGVEIADCIIWLQALRKKLKESLHITEICKEDADSFTDEDERIRKKLIEIIGYFRSRGIDHQLCEEFLSYLERQKERGPLTKEEEYILHRIIEYLEDETCPSEWISLLHNIYCLPYEKQKEQKPEERFKEAREKYQVEWSEEDENMFNDILLDMADRREMFKSKGETTFAENTQKKIDWLDSHHLQLKYQSSCPQPKKEWSGRDEEILEFVLGLLDNLVWRRDWEISQAECLEWLVKSLNPTKQEWSEEDEKMRVNILNALTPQLVYSVGKGTCTGTSTYKYDDEIKWLKSLRPSWKPSEEQMNILSQAVEAFSLEDNEEDAETLASLYNDLKKLI